MNLIVTMIRRVDRLVWIGVGLALPLVLLLLMLMALRLHGPSHPLPVYAQVADFNLTNQFGEPVSLESLRGHPWVADIIFTRCAGPCLKMTRQMQELQQAFTESSSVRLVSLTTDPEFDTPPVLKNYGERFGADSNRWVFLTGTKTQIASLAIDSLKLTAIEKPAAERISANDLFVHSTIFVLIDQHGRLRGIYETTGEMVEPGKVKTRILADVRRLEREG